MYGFSTVEEKAVEWNVSPRHVQYLCREGKVEGAVKRAGAWFVPDDASSPTRNTKSDKRPFKYAGTKKKIFDSAITLFSQRGYENVSISDIADTAGIRQSAVYNHFTSKQEILDTIYAYFRHYYLSNRPSTQDVEALLRSASLTDVFLKGFHYEFEEGSLGHMAHIVRVIMQRSSTDSEAANLFRELMLEEGVRFVEGSLAKGIAIGRFAPADAHSVSVLINCVRLYMLLWWLIDPPYEDYMRIVDDEEVLYKCIAAFMTDLKPPENL